jgi:hypothetical protein
MAALFVRDARLRARAWQCGRAARVKPAQAIVQQAEKFWRQRVRMRAVSPSVCGMASDMAIACLESAGRRSGTSKRAQEAIARRQCIKTP